jgi:hypothetical protein
MMMEANKVEQQLADVLLDRGVRYTIGEEHVVIRPLRFGTTLTIARRVCEAGLTMQTIEEGENNLMQFFADYAELVAECVAIAELNDKNTLTNENIQARVAYYSGNLNMFQIYELFIHVLTLSGIQAFINTIRLIITLKEKNLSPKTQES